MYQCPNCSGGLRYDIGSGQLACDFCNSSFDPYSIDKEKDAEHSDYFEAAVFRCPQCGAQIVSSDETAAAFCSYCGGSTILTDNMRGEKRPDKIIPFKLDKEACKQIYTKRIKRFLFAPKSFLEPDHLDKMTGIYMPYWIYDVTMRDQNSLRSTRDHRSGDYIIHDHYSMTADTDISYSGISFDAASEFDDDISQKIAPFNIRESKEFTPSFLCGFHADIQDLPAETYKEQAAVFAKRDTIMRMEEIFDKEGGSKYGSVDESQNLVHTSSVKQKTGLFPVWFLTWRRDDRVAYAVINGENGRASIDLPVDIRKYLLLVAILTVPIFLLLESFLSLRATTGMLGVMILALATAMLYWGVCIDIRDKEERKKDAGYQARQRMKREEEKRAAEAADPVAAQKVKKERRKGKKKAAPKKPKTARQKRQDLFITVVLIITIAVGVLFAYFWLNDIRTFNLLAFPACVFTVIAFYMTADEDFVDGKGEPDRLKVMKDTFGIPLLAVIGTIAAFLELPSDGIYYVIGVLLLVQTCLSFISMMKAYNRLATRPLPYFDRSGGDESAV